MSGGAGDRGLARPRRCVGGPRRAWLGWAVSAGPVGERWLVPGCHGLLRQGGLGVCVLLGCSGGVLEDCGRGWGGVCGVRSMLVDLWVMHSMVMDEG